MNEISTSQAAMYAEELVFRINSYATQHILLQSELDRTKLLDDRAVIARQITVVHEALKQCHDRLAFIKASIQKSLEEQNHGA